ncbi:MAG: DUF177 domain-containing protein [Actinobacteria bacterium]|nr:DUF177 domain-containing protein [Actinomycetota bacterium]
MRRFDLRSLRFGDSSEVWRRLPVEVDHFVYGGLDYEVAEGSVDFLLTAARVGDNVTLSGELGAAVIGPCQRCLGDADVVVEARGVEYVRHGDSEGAEEDEEGYVTSFIVDVGRWARDLIAEELPPKLLCRAECRGLCVVCGADLNADPEHRHDAA